MPWQASRTRTATISVKRGGGERRTMHTSDEARSSRPQRKLETVMRALGESQTGAGRSVLGRAVWRTKSRLRQPRILVHVSRRRERGSKVSNEQKGLRDGRGVWEARQEGWSEFVHSHFSRNLEVAESLQQQRMCVARWARAAFLGRATPAVARQCRLTMTSKPNNCTT